MTLPESRFGGEAVFATVAQHESAGNKAAVINRQAEELTLKH